MRWSWEPYNFPRDRTPDEMRRRDIAIIEHLSELEAGCFPPQSSSAGVPPIRGCTCKSLPDECAQLYPAPKGQCVRPIGAVPRGVTPAFITDADGKHAFCPWQVADLRPAARVQTSHEARAPHIPPHNRRRKPILAFLASAIRVMSEHPEPRIAQAARYYAPQSLHEHIAGVPIAAPGEVAALELAEHIRMYAASVKPWHERGRM